MTKYLLTLATLIAGISCATHAMNYYHLGSHSQQPESYHPELDACNPNECFIAQQYVWPQQTYIPSITKEEIQTRKFILASNKLAYKQATLCAELLRTHENQLIIHSTEETRKNAAIYLQAWSELLHIHTYSMPQ